MNANGMNKLFQLSFICTSFYSFSNCLSDALLNDETEIKSLSIFFLFRYLCFFYFLITRIMFTYSSYLFISLVLHSSFSKTISFSNVKFESNLKLCCFEKCKHDGKNVSTIYHFVLLPIERNLDLFL